MTPLDDFHQCLCEHSDGKVRLELDLILCAFQQVHPELAASPSARGKLREMLDCLELDERLELPKGRQHWDGLALPPLPQWVKLPRDGAIEAKKDLRSIPWCPELRFLALSRVLVPF